MEYKKASNYKYPNRTGVWSLAAPPWNAVKQIPDDRLYFSLPPSIITNCQQATSNSKSSYTCGCPVIAVQLPISTY